MSDDASDADWNEPDWSETGRQLAESGKLQPKPDLTKMMRRLRVLIVGAGAVGQVYGYHLKLAGAHVAVFVKPKYAADAVDGFTLHCYGVLGKRPKRHFQPDRVISDIGELREHTFDQVWLCVSSPALRDGFLERLFESCITASIWVSVQAGIKDRQFLTETIPAERLVSGMVNFIAYQAPLPGEDLWPAGIAFFIPPWSMTPFSADRELVASAVANALQRGTGPLVGSVVPDATIKARSGSAVLIPFVIALESVNWSIAEMRANQAVVDLMRTAIVDLQLAIERATQRPPGKWAIVQKPWFWKAALVAAPYVTGFPLEAYLKHHFTKVREQSDGMVDDLIDLCRDNMVEPRSLEALREQWRSRRGAIGSLDASEYDTRTGARLGVATPMPAVAPTSESASGPGSEPAASSVEFRAADVSQSLVVGETGPIEEFESEDTPPPPSNTALVEPRERQDTPLALLLPVAGISDHCEEE